MKNISMLEFRRDVEAIIRKVQRGADIVLTYRGKPVLKLEPIVPKANNKEPVAKTDSLMSICKLGEKWIPPGPQTSLTNAEIDRIVYDR